MNRQMGSCCRGADIPKWTKQCRWKNACPGMTSIVLSLMEEGVTGQGAAVCGRGQFRFGDRGSLSSRCPQFRLQKLISV